VVARLLTRDTTIHPAKTAIRRKVSLRVISSKYFCLVICNQIVRFLISYDNSACWPVSGARMKSKSDNLYILLKTQETKIHQKRFQCEYCFYLCAMEEKLKFILEESSKLFMRYGIRSMSMDDVARQLGISKKTLYQYFADKKELVQSVMKFHMDQTNTCFHGMKETPGNAIDILLRVSQILIEQMGQMNPSVTSDLSKYYPESFKTLMDYKRGQVLDHIERNLQQGIKEGLYRKEMNTRVIAYFYLIRMDQVMTMEPDDEKMKNITTEAILNELFVYHVRGIANEKGIEYLENTLMKDLKNKNK